MLPETVNPEKGNCRKSAKHINGKRAEKAEAAPKDGLVTLSTHGRRASLKSAIAGK